MSISSNKGFTIIELIVVLSIVAILTAIGVQQYVAVADDARLSSLVENLESLVRRAQSYAVSAKEAPAIGGNPDFTSRYAVFVDKDARKITFFGDRDGVTTDTRIPGGDFKYSITTDSKDFKIEEIILSGGFSISKINNYSNNSSPTDLCSGTLDSTNKKTVTIGFIRPQQKPIIMNNGNQINYTCTKITITSPSGKSGTVTIENGGSIYATRN